MLLVIDFWTKFCRVSHHVKISKIETLMLKKQNTFSTTLRIIWTCHSCQDLQVNKTRQGKELTPTFFLPSTAVAHLASPCVACLWFFFLFALLSLQFIWKWFCFSFKIIANKEKNRCRLSKINVKIIRNVKLLNSIIFHIVNICIAKQKKIVSETLKKKRHWITDTEGKKT